MKLQNEFEQAILGACIVESQKALPLVRQVLPVEAVFFESNRTIYRAICELDDSEKPIEPLFLMDAVGESIAPTITKLIESFSSLESLNHQCRWVIEQYKRRLIKQSLVLSAEPNNDTDSQALVAELTGIVESVERLNTDRDDRSLPINILAQCQSILEGNAETTRLRTGVDMFDHLTGGGLASDAFYVIGALSGIGKTTFASALVARALQSHDDLTVHWYSSEITEPQQMFKLLGQMFTKGGFRIDERLMREPNKIPFNKVQSFHSHMAQLMAEATGWDLRIFREGTIDARQVRNRTRVFRNEHPERKLIVVVDYLQNCTVGKSEKSDEVEGTSNIMREIALSQSCIVLGLTQFTESYANDGTIPMPNSNNTRNSKTILNDATEFVVFHRPFRDDHAVIQLIKSRYGEPGHVLVEQTSHGFRRCQFETGNIQLHTQERT
jgi:replicative DNA helicase